MCCSYLNRDCLTIMCFYKYEMSGRTILHNVICVEWLKIGNCENFEVRHKFVATNNLLSRQGWF